MNDINFWAVLVCAIVSMVLGSIWYGLLFGKKWMEITGASSKTAEERKKMQQSAGPLYAIQFFMSLFQAYVLAYYIVVFKGAPGIDHALWICAAFILPTVAQAAMWNNDSKKVCWARFLIQAGYQIILFVIFGLILGAWR